MYTPDICIDILDSLPTTKCVLFCRCTYLLFCRYISSLFCDAIDRYLIKKISTKALYSTQEFLEAKKWISKKFKMNIDLCNKKIDSASFLENANIQFLDISRTSVFDLFPLRNSSIKGLWTSNTPIKICLLL